MIFEKTIDYLRLMKQGDTYPDVKIIDTAPTLPEVKIEGRKTIVFCSNNYLGLAADSRLKQAAIEATQRYGVGSGGSRLVSGTTRIQIELEKKVADFKKAESAVTFATGYMANIGVLHASLAPPNTHARHTVFSFLVQESKSVAISDEANHASIVDGIRLARADKIIYRHRDMEHLEKVLKKVRRYSRKLIATDGVFSMDGDITPLPDIMRLARQYDATVLVDDAHATGVLGASGRGTTEYFHLKEEPDILMGTFTKSFGGVGGFIASKHDFVDYLRVTARPYIFSAPIPPAICAAMVTSIGIVESEHERRKRLWDNVLYLRQELRKEGFNMLASETQIIPILIGSDEKAIRVSRMLLNAGIFAPCIRWPAVPHGKSRLRITLMTTHTKQHIDILLETLKTIRKNCPF